MTHEQFPPCDIYADPAEFLRAESKCRGYCGKDGLRVGALDMILRAKDGQSFMVVSPSGAAALEIEGVARGLGLNVSREAEAAHWQMLGGGRASVTYHTGDPGKILGPCVAGVWIVDADLQHRDAFAVANSMLRLHGVSGWMSMTFSGKE